MNEPFGSTAEKDAQTAAAWLNKANDAGVIDLLPVGDNDLRITVASDASIGNKSVGELLYILLQGRTIHPRETPYPKHLIYTVDHRELGLAKLAGFGFPGDNYVDPARLKSRTEAELQHEHVVQSAPQRLNDLLNVRRVVEFEVSDAGRPRLLFDKAEPVEEILGHILKRKITFDKKTSGVFELTDQDWRTLILAGVELVTKPARTMNAYRLSMKPTRAGLEIDSWKDSWGQYILLEPEEFRALLNFTEGTVFHKDLTDRIGVPKAKLSTLAKTGFIFPGCKELLEKMVQGISL